jgi:hypothetical protein
MPCCCSTIVRLRQLALLALAASRAAANSKECTNAARITAACGPGNDQCNASQLPPLPRYHVIDYSCGENDPNGPCYDPRHKIYHVRPGPPASLSQCRRDDRSQRGALCP